MKKLFNIMLLITLSITLVGCKDTEDPYVVDCDQFPNHADCIEIIDPVVCDEGYYEYDNECLFDDRDLGDYLDIYYLNDFHGALLPDSDQIGISYIANLINTRKTQSPDNVLFLAGGDMLQGSAISNYYNGLSTINILNAMGLDAFTIGNHEFDWGIETVTQYRDGDLENGEANFPFLGANIFYRLTDDVIEGLEPYTIIEKGGHRIGVIGTIESGIEYAIAQSRIDGYVFDDPVAEIAYYSAYLRQAENCDVIIVVAHDRGLINYEISLLTGNSRVDAIFNGHSHNAYTNYQGGIPVLQAGSNGEYVGHLRITFNNEGIGGTVMQNIGKYGDALLFTEDETVATLLAGYQAETDILFNDPIITSDEYYSSYELTAWLAKLMRVSTNADIAFHNYGGTRTSIDENQVITLSVLYNIWPFDNVVKTVELKGSVVNNLLASNAMGYDTTVTNFEPDTYYLVATNDYVFDKTTNPFLDGENPNNTGIVLRDLVQAELVLQAVLYPTFRTDNDILTTPIIIVQNAPYNYKEEQ